MYCIRLKSVVGKKQFICVFVARWVITHLFNCNANLAFCTSGDFGNMGIFLQRSLI